MDDLLKSVRAMLNDPNRPKPVPLAVWLAQTGYRHLDPEKDKERVQQLLREARGVLCADDWEQLTLGLSEEYPPSPDEVARRLEEAFSIWSKLESIVSEWQRVYSWWEKHHAYGWLPPSGTGGPGTTPEHEWDRVQDYNTWFVDLIMAFAAADAEDKRRMEDNPSEEGR